MRRSPTGKFWDSPIVREQSIIANLTWVYLSAYVVVRFEKLHPFYFRQFPEEQPKIESCWELMNRVYDLNPVHITGEIQREIDLLFNAGINWLMIAMDFAKWMNSKSGVPIPECELIAGVGDMDSDRKLYEYCKYKFTCGEWREPTDSEVEK